MRRIWAIFLSAMMICMACVSVLAQEDYSGITLHVVDINADSEGYNKMIDAFIADHPGLTVETTHAVNDAQVVMASLIAGNDAPDIYVSTPEQVNVYKEYLYDWRNDEEVLAQFQEGIVEAITAADGSIYGLPNSRINVGLVYNKDVLAAAGYDSIPLTISGFEEMCAAIAEKTDAVPFVIGIGSGFLQAQMIDAYMITKDQPGSVLAAKLNAGEVTVSGSNRNFNNFWRMLDIATTYIDGETLLEYSWEYPCNMLANGKAAVISYGDWGYGAIADFNADVNLGLSSYPVSEDEADAVTPTSVNQIAMLFQNGENFDLAKELAAFLTTSYESAEYFISDFGGVSCNIAGAQVDPALYNDLLLQADEIAQAGRTVDRMQNYFPAGNPNYMTEVGEVIQGYVIGLYSQEEANALIDAAWVAG